MLVFLRPHLIKLPGHKTDVYASTILYCGHDVSQ